MSVRLYEPMRRHTTLKIGGPADALVEPATPAEVTALADVVFPVAPVAEKDGTFLNWEGRLRSFDAALSTNATPDLRVLGTLADELGVDLGFRTAAEARLLEQADGNIHDVVLEDPANPAQPRTVSRLVHVVTDSIDSYNEFLNKRLLGHPSVRSASSSFSLKQIKYTTRLPL